MPVLRYVIAFLIFAALVGLYITTYLLNQRTKKPEGTENLTSGCAGCHIVSCGHRTEEEN